MAKVMKYIYLLLILSISISCSSVEEQAITHGPILGRLAETEIGVWARTLRQGSFYVRYGTDKDHLDNVFGPVFTELKRDNSGWAHIKNLKANTKYYYAVCASATSKSLREHQGSFRTLPRKQQMIHPTHNPKGLFNFSFEFGCGNSQEGGSSPEAFGVMVNELDDRIHFAILNGDWLYENKRDYTVEAWKEQVGISGEPPRIVGLAPSIVGVWENYKHYLSSSKDLAAWHREIPSFFIYDDHEILNDITGTGTIGLKNNEMTVFRDIGVRAWYDYIGWSNPISFKQKNHFGRAQLQIDNDVLVDNEADFTSLNLDEMSTLLVHWEAKNNGVYGVTEVLGENKIRITPKPTTSEKVVYSIGRRSYFKKTVSNAEFFVTDTRGHRQMHDIKKPFQPGVSMLGKKQKFWLKKHMKESDADFLFVVSTVNLMVPHVQVKSRMHLKEYFKNKDEAWTAIAAEREELIKFWDSLGKPVFVLTGDLHNSFVVKISDNVYEFASGPHSSINHTLEHESYRPANGNFKSRGRSSEILWSTFLHNDIENIVRKRPNYCVVKVNNTFRQPVKEGVDVWAAYPKPQVIFQYYDGLNGELLYAQSFQGVGK